MKKTILGVVALAVLIIAAYAGYNMLSPKYAPELPEPDALSNNAALIDGSEPGKEVQAPDFTVTDIDGNEVKLSDFSGKPVVLNFWASWCPPCKAEMPEFDKLYAEIGDEIVFLMVDLVDGTSETVEKGSQHVIDNGYSFPVYYDTSQEAARAYEILYIPMTLFIDNDGYIAAKCEGLISETALRAGIARIRP